MFFSFIDTKGSIIYVDLNAVGLNDGTSWTDAFTDLNIALLFASPDDDIWVTVGTYYPTSTNNRESTFNLRNQIDMFGGFIGGESDIDSRDHENRTTLSGNIGDPDAVEDNSRHISWVSTDYVEMRLDGFIVRDGYAEGSSGGAIYTNLGYITFYNCIFKNNYCLYGGAICSTNSSMNYLYCVFENNSGVWGGAYQCWGGTDDRFYNCDFINNSSEYLGGAITAQLNTQITVDNCRFIGNSGDLGGAIAIENNGQLNCMNSIFNGNNANSGAAIYITGNSQFNCYNSAVVQNNATLEGGGIFIETGNAFVRNSVLRDNFAAGNPDNIIGSDTSINVSYSILESPIPGPGNIVAVPLFIDPDGIDNIAGNLDDNFHIQLFSPGINMGSALNLPLDLFDWNINGNHTEPYPFDLDHNPRISDGSIDIGPYEKQFLTSILEPQDFDLIVGNPYPNPSFVSYLDIELKEKKAVQISLVNLKGQVLFELFNGLLFSGIATIEIQVPENINGLHLLEIRFEDQVYYRKWMISS